MNATTAKPTPGPWSHRENPTSSFGNHLVESHCHAEGVKETIATHVQPADAAFIVEAATVYHETGLTPRQLAREVRDLKTNLKTVGAQNAQLADQRAELLAALERARDWLRGDKWRFSDIPGEVATWEKFCGDIDTAIARAKVQP